VPALPRFLVQQARTPVHWNAAGQLPADFDPLVRESFGDLLVG